MVDIDIVVYIDCCQAFEYGLTAPAVPLRRQMCGPVAETGPGSAKHVLTRQNGEKLTERCR